MTRILNIFNMYQDYIQFERTWFQCLSVVARNILTDRGRVPDSELALYGEIGFLLLGLKPCVLIEHIPRDHGIFKSYLDEVCEPWFDKWFRSNNMTTTLQACGIHIVGQVITHDLQSTEISLQGCYLVTNTKHEKYNVVTKWLLDPAITQVKEEILAQVLDYPGSLPHRPQQISTMVRVGYIDTKTGYWLTTYAGQSSQLPDIHTHFRLYRQAVHQYLGTELKLDVETLG